MMKTYIAKHIFIFILFLTLSGYSQKASLIMLNEKIRSLQSDSTMLHASFGLYIKNLSTGKIISELNAEQSLTPASVMKIPTTVAALSLLGKDFRFTTKLGYSGEIDKGGNLKGNIFIIGGGDPTFGSMRFGDKYSINAIYEKWYKKIAEAGIKNITGKIIADAGIFDEHLIAGKWFWNDFGNYYGAGACGLNICENYYTISFKPGNKLNDNASAEKLSPEMPYIRITNNVTTGKAGSGDNVIIYGTPYDNYCISEGTVPIDKPTFEVKASMSDPPYYCAYAFNKYLNEKSIRTSEPPATVRTEIQTSKYILTEKKILDTHYSPELEEIIKQTNLKSINIYAEAILKMSGYKKNNSGSFDSGIKAVKDFLNAKDIDINGMQMYDGSGLSVADKLTAKQLVEMLEYSQKDEKIKDAFYNSLPVAGVSGSIKDFFKGTAAENNLRAKSGYMNSVRAYAGFVKNKKGENIAFSIIINNYSDAPLKLKAKLEKLMIAIAEIN